MNRPVPSALQGSSLNLRHSRCPIVVPAIDPGGLSQQTAQCERTKSQEHPPSGGAAGVAGGRVADPQLDRAGEGRHRKRGGAPTRAADREQQDGTEGQLHTQPVARSLDRTTEQLSEARHNEPELKWIL